MEGEFEGEGDGKHETPEGEPESVSKESSLIIESVDIGNRGGEEGREGEEVRMLCSLLGESLGQRGGGEGECL